LPIIFKTETQKQFWVDTPRPSPQFHGRPRRSSPVLLVVILIQHTTPGCNIHKLPHLNTSLCWHDQLPDFSPNISSEYLTYGVSTLTTKRNAMLFLNAILIHTLITMTAMFFNRLQWNNSLFLFVCTTAIKSLDIFHAKNNTRGNWVHAMTHFPFFRIFLFSNFSQTTLKFPFPTFPGFPH